ncbi:MAG: roadblock/LC7 domain-containing protein [Acidobacteria bacterium]|nr:roadblock/LC7 domain-containing protein [Acidobacteriota bacterium]
MFRTTLEEAARRLPGCEAAALVGRDGMVVEHWASPGGPSPEVIAAELTPVVRSVEALGRNAGGGGVRDLTLRLEAWSCVVQPVSADLFLILVAGRNAVPGRVRFEASRAAARLESDLR